MKRNEIIPGERRKEENIVNFLNPFKVEKLTIQFRLLLFIVNGFWCCMFEFPSFQQKKMPGFKPAKVLVLLFFFFFI